MKATPVLAVGLCFVAGNLPAAEPVDYLSDIKPILSKHCVNCHGAQKQRSGLRLDTAKSVLEGGNSGPAVVPGKSSESLLVQAVGGVGKVKPMPPPEQPRLSGEQIALLKHWIDQGAKAPANETVESGANKSSHWAFQPVRRPAVPPAPGAGAWVQRNPIDHFIQARLVKEKLAPSPEADRPTLLRRVSLDLTGLPPTPEQVEAVLNDRSPDWYEKVVDRLLASPHYGERQARHWLDLARYADSNGYTIDAARSIWKYRDWVIDAFNRDLPFDQFTIEQLAGDLLPGATVEQRVATGFHRNTQINQEGGIDVEQFRVEAVVDRVNTTGQVWLGITIGCAQCHDHKFDPLSQREYYQLFAFLNTVDEPTLEMPTPEQLQRRQQLRAQIAGVEKELRLLDIAPANKERDWENKVTADVRIYFPEEIQRILGLAPGSRDNKQKQLLTAFYLQANHMPHAIGGIGDPLPLLALAHFQASMGRTALDRHRAELRKVESEVVTSMVVQERKTPRTTNVMIQGDFTRKGVQVGPGVPSVLHPLPPKTGLSRLDLARWLVDGKSPLTARVTVNRFWQHLFGTGIVETENDFGTQGTPPSHPELLDWLASEFMTPSPLTPLPLGERGTGEPKASAANAWSMKALHRLIVTSATYRQSSQHRPDLQAVDARNRLLARQNRLRLEGEVVRDVALACSGLLHRKIGGPSVFPPQAEGVYRFTQINKNWKADSGPDRYRRGMYTFFWRSAPHPALTVFDAPDASMACTRRNRSNTPLQALTLLNDQAYFEFAQALAGRVLREGKPSQVDRVRHACLLCLGRLPNPKEEERLNAFLAQQLAVFEARPQEAKELGLGGQTNSAELAAWTMLSRALLNLDEFITRE
jgi:mono/diheme cytochrome c family protein